MPSHHRPSGFRNLDPEFRHGLSLARVRHFGRRLGPMLRGEPAGPPLTLAVTAVAALRANRERPTVTWVGHSTFLVQLDGVNFLTDPNWSTRSGPFGGLVGVGRYTPPGLAFEDLPRIDFVVISHDHYDHLDEPTVRRLAATFNPRFVVPLRLKAWLADRGIRNAVELDWGASTTVGPLTITSTPVQHFSGRTVIDQGRRLWTSWLVTGSKRL